MKTVSWRDAHRRLFAVAMMEPSWRAMIDSRREQVQTLSSIADSLPTLATSEADGVLPEKAALDFADPQPDR